MPIPQPEKGEKEEDFITHAPGDKVLNKDYPNEKQRSGVCYSQWNDKNKKKGAAIMEDIVTKENLKTAYPEILGLIEKEAFEKGLSEGAAKGKADGAEAERNRIKNVEDQLIPGHEALVNELKFDGKTTGPEAAVMILKKEKSLMASKLGDLKSDGEKIKVPDVATVEEKPKVDPAVQLEGLVKEKMKTDKSISYRNALIEAQRENPELAKEIYDQLEKLREKK